MCGIAGFYLREGKADLASVRAMCDQIRHRGPDDEGYHVEGGCAIGMRRLSIIDLSTGHQPMTNEDESVWVVFNGEIYNYQELRRDLMARGHRFATNSDTETLVHGAAACFWRAIVSERNRYITPSCRKGCILAAS